MLPRRPDFFIERNPDWIDHWVRQIVDRFDRAAVIFEAAVVVMRPIERINSELKALGDSNLEFFANENVVPVRSMLPRYRVLQLNTSRRRSRRFVKKCKMTHAGDCANRRQDRQQEDR